MTTAYADLEQRGVTYPYMEVLDFVPRAVPGGMATPWSHWRWGQMDHWFHDKVNANARDKIESRRAGSSAHCPISRSRSTTARPSTSGTRSTVLFEASPPTHSESSAT